MKKFAKIIAVVMLFVLALSCTSCQLIDKFLPQQDNQGDNSNVEEPAPEKAIVGTYVNGYVDAEGFHCIDSLVLYDDNTYELTVTHISAREHKDRETGEVLGWAIYAADSVITTGTYTAAESEDGVYEPINLAAAERVIFNRNVMSGMFVKNIDSELSEFPVTYIGDDVTPISREQFMSDYGSAVTLYIVLDGDLNRTAQLVREIK